VLRYLTTVGSSTGTVETESGSIMDKVLQSNPILEAFGNAKTIRNDNSSRFGKFIELNFNRRGHLVGGTIRTYLLEKVRIPYQQLGERNFHIFYQMLAGGSAEEKEVWGLPDVEDVFYANQGNEFILKFVDDCEEFDAMRKALGVLGFEETFRTSLLTVMAGLLHLGQCSFVSDASGEGSQLSDEGSTMASMSAAARLLGVPEQDLVKAITIRIIVARNEQYEKTLTPTQASDARDAVVKALYGRIFDWLVVTINKSIAVDAKQVRANIGVLDIFGFECFKYNSFEQLCINYTNETLQQQFNQFVFKMEQEEYQREKIEWSFVEFPDNQDCLDLIEHRLTGVLAVLDDECRLPGASDEKFHSRLVKTHGGHVRFSCSNMQKRNGEFGIKHYAGLVTYSTSTFVEKNKDEFPLGANALMDSSVDPLIQHLFAEARKDAEKKAPDAAARMPRASKVTAQSVGSQFKEQLLSLMDKIYATSPHYIRCLKPNDQNVPDCFDRMRTTEQLRYGGVLEAVRVARSGFPVRLSHIDFYSRYRPLANPFSKVTSRLPRVLEASVKNPRDYCETLIQALWDDTVPSADDDDNDGMDARMRSNRRASRIEDMQQWKGEGSIAQESVQLGLTKTFLRKMAHDILEARRSRRLTSASVKIQASYRKFLQRSWYLAICRAAALVERLYRGHMARVVVHTMRLHDRAKRLQTCYRCHVAFQKYAMHKYAVVRLQSGYRGVVSRRETKKLWFQVKGTKLKYACLMLQARSQYLKMRRACVALQCSTRRRIARQVLKKKKAEAKDVGKLQQNNDSLKAEIEMLRAKAAEDAARLQEQMRKDMEALSVKQKDEEHEALLRELSETKAALAEEKELRIQAEEALQAAQAAQSQAGGSLQPGQVAASQEAMEELEALRLSLEKEQVSRVALENEIVRLRNVTLNQEAHGHGHGHGHKGSSGTRSRNTSVGEEGNPQNQPATHHQRKERPRSIKVSGPGAKVLQDAVTPDSNQSGRQTPEQEAVTPTRSGVNMSLVKEMSANGKWDDDWDNESDDGSVFSENSDRQSISRRMSFSEKPMPEAYHRRAVDTAPQNAAQALALMGTFERNLGSFKSKLSEGVKVEVVDTHNGPSLPLSMKYVAPDTIKFVTPPRRFTIFAAKADCAPILVSQILECIPGAYHKISSTATTKDDSRYLTIVSHAPGHAPRNLSILVESREERNAILTGLRTLVSDMHMSASNDDVDLTTSDSTTGGTQTTKAVRRASFRDTILAEANKEELGGAGGGTDKAARRGSLTGESTSEVKRQLLVERSNYEKLMVQMLVLTNDLNEREDQIIAMKKREAAFEEQLASKEKMYEQDAKVRMQLGKRLEDVLMDKEEIKDELDNLKAQLEMIRSGLR